MTDWPRGAATEIHGFVEVFGRAPSGHHGARRMEELARCRTAARWRRMQELTRKSSAACTDFASGSPHRIAARLAWSRTRCQWVRGKEDSDWSVTCRLRIRDRSTMRQ